MDPGAIWLIPFVLIVVLGAGRVAILWRELGNARRTRLDREAQARSDHERFARELTDEAVRQGAR